MRICPRTVASQILVLVLTFVGHAQEVKGSASLLDRVRKGDTAAIEELARSNDEQYIQLLASLEKDPNYPSKRQARLAMAKLGDKNALQYYACRSLTDDVDKMQLRIRDEFDHIGGAFTVEIYRQLLDSDSRFLPQIEKNKSHKYSDVIVTMPSSMVLFSLPKLVPNPPIASPKYVGDDSSRDETYKTLWKNWIKIHADEISKLTPSPKGIRFDAAFCSRMAGGTF